MEEIEEIAKVYRCDIEAIIKEQILYEIYPIKEGYDIDYLRRLDWDILSSEYII